MVSLRPAFIAALNRSAEQLKMTSAEAAAHLLSDALRPYFGSEEKMRLEAEIDLLRLAERLAQSIASEGPWDPHLTLRVFKVIENDHLKLYRAATQGGDKSDINRRIGRRIREATGSAVMVENGKPITVAVSRRDPSLISRYTLLAQ